MILETATMTIPEVPLAWRWSSHTFRAMNTNVYTSLLSRANNAEEILLDVENLFNSFEKRLSRFNPNSELSRLNACQKGAFQASPTLLQAVQVALWAAETTHGIYDPTIINDLEKVGYDRSFEQVENTLSYRASSTASQSANATPSGWRPPAFRTAQISHAAGKIFKPPKVRLDLGGMGKGWTVDRAADRLQGLGPFLVNAGGDIFAYQTPPGQRGWQINLIHPLKPEQFMGSVYLHHQGLATSTIAKRRWQRNGQVMHHLIDPRTGFPAKTDALSVSVVAPRTVLAEIYAKVALIIGVEHGLNYLQRIPDVEGLIYTAENQIVYTNGMADMLEKMSPDGYVN